MLVWPEVTAPHHGASPPHGTTRVSLQHGSWGTTASRPREPGGSLCASRVTYVITQVGPTQTGRDGQGRDCQGAESLEQT